MTKLTGIWGLAFLIVLVNVALAEVIPPAPNNGGARGEGTGGDARPIPAPPLLGAGGAFPLLTAVLVIATLLYGFLTIRDERLRPTFVAAALQGTSTRTSTRTRPT